MVPQLAILLSVFRMVVIPVQFQDRQFSCTEAELEQTVLLAQDYFNDQSGGETEFIFDLAPAVTLSKPCSYYGSNYSDRRDALLYEAVREACSLVSDRIDFSLYDNDADGYVDNVFILAAGLSEADGASSDNIWPQQGKMSDFKASFSMDGKTVDSFAVSCELASDSGLNPRPAGIGVFCHELAHVFGLHDLYDTDGTGSGGESEGLWSTSLMDEGCKNSDGNCPPNLNALDLETLGAGTMEELATGDYRLEPIDRSRRYLKYETGIEGEYFLFECRAPEGWDAPLGTGGLLIYHIDKSSNPAGLSDYYGRELTASERMRSMPWLMKSWASVRRARLRIIREVNFGLISRMRGMSPRRILLRRYLVERFDESSRKGMRCCTAYSRISLREANSSGRMTFPTCVEMPVRPRSPVPRSRLMKKVSIESSMWWAMAMTVYPSSQLNASNQA